MTFQKLDLFSSSGEVSEVSPLRTSLLKSVIVTEFQVTEAYSSLDRTKAKYSISRLFMVERENVILRISPSNFSECEERKST
jgi:hypothetical protein